MGTTFVIGRGADGNFEVSQTIESAPSISNLSALHQAFASNALGVTGQESASPAVNSAKPKSWARDFQV